jgi:nitrogen fixation protein FixH
VSAVTDRPLTGRRVLAIALASFAVVAAVNAIMITLALTSFSGVETEDAYLKGLHYGQTLARAEAQRRLGWHLAWAVAPAPGGHVLEVRLADAKDRPLRGLTLSARLRRPTNEDQDVSLSLAPAGDGVYRSEPAGFAAGNWNLTVLVERGGETVFRRDDRMWVK